jgi:hypothetical protein
VRRGARREKRERRENKSSSDGAAKQHDKAASSLARSLLELLLPQTLDVKGMKTMELHHNKGG